MLFSFNVSPDGLGWNTIFDSLFRTYENLRTLNFTKYNANPQINNLEKKGGSHDK